MMEFGLPPVIGLIGPMRAGKDTICQALQNRPLHTNHKVVRMALADEVKRHYGEQNGMTLEEVEANKAQHRAGLQKLGESLRERDPMYWVDRLVPKLPRPGEGVTAVITDVRYVNESYSLLQLPGAILVRVDTPHDVRLQRYQESVPGSTLEDFQDASQHRSEQEWRYCAHHCRFRGDVPLGWLASEFWRMLERVTPEDLVYPQAPATRPMVYIAGPISQSPNLYHTTGHAIQAWHMLYSLGYAPFCPYLSGPVDYVKPLEYADWLDYDFNIISHSRAVYRLHGDSPGADREVRHAQSLGIPVWYEGEIVPPASVEDVTCVDLDRLSVVA